MDKMAGRTSKASLTTCSLHLVCSWKKKGEESKQGTSRGRREEEYDDPRVPGMSAVHKLCCWKAQGSGSPCQLPHSTVPRSKL